MVKKKRKMVKKRKMEKNDTSGCGTYCKIPLSYNSFKF